MHPAQSVQPAVDQYNSHDRAAEPAGFRTGRVVRVVPGDPEATQPLPPPAPPLHPVLRPPLGLIAVLAAGVVIAGAVLALLVERIDRDPAAAAEAPPHTFATPEALVEYLGGHGLPCGGYESVASAGTALHGRCAAGGAAVAVGVYKIHSEVEAQWAATAGVRQPVFMALGENWSVDGPADWTRQVADVLNVQYRARL